MSLDLLLGATSVVGMAGGVWALVLHRKNGNGNGKPAPEAHVAQIKPPAWTENLEQVADVCRQAGTDLEHSLGSYVLRLEALSTIPPPPPPELTANLERINDRLEGLLRLGPPPAPPDLTPSLEAIADRLEEVAASIPELDGRPELAAALARGLAELPALLSRQVAEIVAAERKSMQPLLSAAAGFLTSPPPATIAVQGGTNWPGPPRLTGPAPALPKAPSPPPPIPSVPPPYVGGTVWTPAGTVANLLLLIQQQLAPNCPGTCVEFRLEADAEVYVGAASSIGGALTTTNYAYALAAATPRLYRSNFAGSSTPIGDLQVLASVATALHVEVQL
jgi:hypothetical protein